MNTIKSLVLIVAVATLAGCAHGVRSSTPIPAATYREPPAIVTSLFPSDQAVLGDEAVARILSSRLELPAKAKLALMRFPDNQGWGPRYYGGDYWRNEEFLRVQQAQVDTLTSPLRASDAIAEITPLPSLMTPRQITIPVLREAAVRLQADLLLIFRVGSETYSQYRLFAKDKVKAYSTCEVVLLDVRTGLVPFTRIVSRERLEMRQNTDLDMAETMRRAEQTSAMDALGKAAGDLVDFIKNAPRKSG